MKRAFAVKACKKVYAVNNELCYNVSFCTDLNLP